MENTNRTGFENAVDVYCILSVKPGKPQAQVGVTLRLTLTIAVRLIVNSTASAVQTNMTGKLVTMPGRIAPGIKDCDKTVSGFNTTPGAMPSTTHGAARSQTPSSMAGRASRADSASSLRGRPRNATPYTLMKHAAARPPIRASAPAIKGRIIRAYRLDRVEPARKL